MERSRKSWLKVYSAARLPRAALIRCKRGLKEGNQHRETTLTPLIHLSDPLLGVITAIGGETRRFDRFCVCTE